MGAENLAPTGIRSADRPARSESLYRLSYHPQGVIFKLVYWRFCNNNYDTPWKMNVKDKGWKKRRWKWIIYILRKKCLRICVEGKKKVVKTSVRKLGLLSEFGASYVRNEEGDASKRSLCQYCLIGTWHTLTHTHTHTHTHTLPLCVPSLSPAVQWLNSIKKIPWAR